MEGPLIGLTGKMCSGKDSWAHFLVEQFGFVWQNTSDIAREYIAAHHLGEPTRDRVREICTHLRNQHGADYLVREALKRMDSSKPRVVSGLYSVPEADHLQAVGGKLLAIVTEETLLFSRMVQRRREGEPGRKAAFDRLMQQDLLATETDQRLADVLAMAEVTIDGSVSLTQTDQCRTVVIAAFKALGVYHATVPIPFSSQYTSRSGLTIGEDDRSTGTPLHDGGTNH